MWKLQLLMNQLEMGNVWGWLTLVLDSSDRSLFDAYVDFPDPVIQKKIRLR